MHSAPELSALADVEQGLDQIREVVRLRFQSLDDAVCVSQELRELLYKLQQIVRETVRSDEPTFLLDGLRCAVEQVDRAMSDEPRYSVTMSGLGGFGDSGGYENITERLRMAKAIATYTVQHVRQQLSANP